MAYTLFFPHLDRGISIISGCKIPGQAKEYSLNNHFFIRTTSFLILNTENMSAEFYVTTIGLSV